ncbi:hypothetical protein [Allosphingosinicella indica]|uniref:Uncharacterized protein n=1 Tax=Allosphingosinicella indica TaxID=941907 RepID=A0A1X7G083_9SPHN|nr:hypothetical protein [Allosphingosinicella indica]SMF61751.1 hypothetical protein SAMN06295910_0744 [Allosphingosinicella indica]
MIRVAGAALLLALAGCDGGPQTPQPAASPAANAYADRLVAMPEGERNAVLIRAIRDAGQDCQQVVTSIPAGPAGWDARCDDDRPWRISIGANGDASVIPLSEPAG